MQCGGGIVAVSEIDESVGIAGRGCARARGFDESCAARTVDSAQAHHRAARPERQAFSLKEHVPGRCSSSARFFGHRTTVVLRIDRGAPGEDAELRAQYFEEIAQSFHIGDAVGVRIASAVSAQAMDEEIGCGLARKATLQFGAVRGVYRKDLVRFIGEPVRRFFRRNQTGDLRPITVKKIRASFAGVTATGDEDARSV